MKQELTIDLNSLASEDAAALEKLIDDADIFNLATPEPQATLRDGFQYEITVERESQQCTFQVSDGSIPKELVPLVNNLSLRARSYRRQG